MGNYISRIFETAPRQQATPVAAAPVAAAPVAVADPAVSLLGGIEKRLKRKASTQGRAASTSTGTGGLGESEGRNTSKKLLGS